ncbi:MAG: protein-disulfide reductase DsbD family protein [Chloroherpetonaceae bacterium]|nr:protein-disulfide reductase DsbD family protein [Chloroherpetonaceae bacterium]
MFLNRSVSVCLGILTVILGISFCSIPVQSQMMKGKPLVTSELLLSSNDFSKPQRIAIHFKIEDGWHLYWKNPGDAGIPIEADWKLPEGFQVSHFEFPSPHKFVEAGIVAYGYEKEVLLFATLTPPNPSKSLNEISVSLSWLVCKENCIPGDSTLNFIPTSLTAETLRKNKDLISKFESYLPLPFSESGLNLGEVNAIPKDGKLFVSFELKGDAAYKVEDFFPESFADFTLDYIGIKTENGKISFALRPNTETSTLTNLTGLIILQGKGYEFSSRVNLSNRSGGSLLEQSFEDTSNEEPLSLGWALLFAFIGGVILNIMPCVLPVLSLKVLSMVENAGASREKSFRHGIFFTLGVLFSFWLLAGALLLLQSAGESVGWGFQFQSPGFVIIMLVVVFLFGLNLVGVFEFSAPAISGSASESLSRKDEMGAFANGVLATTLATPCTAPFLGTAVGFAFSQPGFVIFGVFTLVGLGLASPYLLLSAKPEWLRFVPKPGEWMNRFKQVMGFLLFATAVWLLSVLGAQLGSEGIIAACMLLLGISVSMWMIGSWVTYGTPSKTKFIVYAAAIIFSASSYYIAFESWLNWRALDQVSTSSAKTQQSENSISWKPFTLATVESEVKNGKIVFIDFTAEWCFTCKVTEKTILETEPVRKAISALGIVPLRADWTNRNPEITSLLKKFKRSGVPLYVIFPAGKLNSPIVLPEVITQEMLLKAFDEANSLSLNTSTSRILKSNE